jgi:hypothetical protein
MPAATRRAACYFGASLPHIASNMFCGAFAPGFAPLGRMGCSPFLGAGAAFWTTIPEYKSFRVGSH